MHSSSSQTIIECCKKLNDRIEPVKKKMKSPTWLQVIQKCYDEGVDLSAKYMWVQICIKFGKVGRVQKGKSSEVKPSRNHFKWVFCNNSKLPRWPAQLKNVPIVPSAPQTPAAILSPMEVCVSQRGNSGLKGSCPGRDVFICQSAAHETRARNYVTVN